MRLVFALFLKPILCLALALAVLAGIYLLPEYWPDHRAASDAILRDDEATLRLYVKRGLDPNELAQWRSAPRKMLSRARPARGTSDFSQAREPLLVEAIDKCKARFAEILMDAGADVNARDQRGYSVLSLTALCDDPELVQSFLRRGANARTREPNGETVLWERGLQGWRLRPAHPEVIRLLKTAGAAPPPR